jgi:hypothetical protein
MCPWLNEDERIVYRVKLEPKEELFLLRNKVMPITGKYINIFARFTVK